MSAPTGGFAEPMLAPAGDPVPAILLPYQVDAVRLSHEHQLFVEEKSRRTGLTYGFAADSVLTAAASRAAGGMDVFYIAYNLDMTREFIDYCGEFTKAFDALASAPSEFLFDDGSEQGIKAFRIDFPSGFSIVALSSKPRSLRGKQGRVIIDEAAFHDALEELLKAALALLMWGGSVVVISTHDGADNPFNELIEQIRAGKRKGHVHTTTLKSALADGLYRRICLRTGKSWTPEAEAAWEADLRKTYGEAAEEELDVIPARGSGAYLARATIKAAMTDRYEVLRLSCADGFERQELAVRTAFVADWLADNVLPRLSLFDRGRRSVFGQDFARTGDLSVVAPGQEDAQLVLHVPFLIEMRAVPFTQQRQVLDFLIRGLPMFSGGQMDARGNGQQLAEEMQQAYGFDRIEAVMASQKTYLERMPKLKSAIEDRTILLPQHEGVLDDLRLIKLVRGVPMIADRAADKTDGAKGKRHGDAAIALMNLVAAADMDVVPMEFASIGTRTASAEPMGIGAAGFGSITRGEAAGGFYV